MKEYTIYDNGKWRINGCRIATGKLVAKVESLRSGLSDWPIRYDDGGIVYDHPELIPQYVKRITASILDPKPRKDQWVRLVDMQGII